MKILTMKINFYYITIFMLFYTINHLNAQQITVKQDNKFEELLEEKRKLNSSLSINSNYKIQIFNGTNENAKKTLIEFKKTNKYIDATIIFNTPTYKVLVGNFKSRIEAERNLVALKKKYTSALLIKPNK